jgi:hypothetical protein
MTSSRYELAVAVRRINAKVERLSPERQRAI